MKRTICLLTALCLVLACFGGAAVAAEEAPLRVIDGSDYVIEAFEEAYPDCKVVNTHPEYEQIAYGKLAEYLEQSNWDVAFTLSDEADLQELIKRGLAMDLREINDLAALADNMYPSIIDAVTVDGKLAALPRAFAASLVMGLKLMGTETDMDYDYYKQSADKLKSLGFTADDQPATFEELCELGVRFMALPKDVRKGVSFISLEASQPAYVLEYLLRLYEMQYLATGLSVSYDTEVFRTALAQWEQLAAALSTDPKNTRDKDGNRYVLVNDSSMTLVNDATFLKLGDATAVPGWMGIAIVNPRSERVEDIVRLLTLESVLSASSSAPELSQAFDYDELVRQSYDRDIAAQIEQGEEQSVIDELVALRDAGDTSHYQYQPEEIAHYRENVAPYLVFPQTRYVDMSAAVQGYLTGKTDADGFISELDKRLSEAR